VSISFNTWKNHKRLERDHYGRNLVKAPLAPHSHANDISFDFEFLDLEDIDHDDVNPIHELNEVDDGGEWPASRVHRPSCNSSALPDPLRQDNMPVVLLPAACPLNPHDVFISDDQELIEYKKLHAASIRRITAGVADPVFMWSFAIVYNSLTVDHTSGKCVGRIFTMAKFTIGIGLPLHVKMRMPETFKDALKILQPMMLGTCLHPMIVFFGT
jgi:hypothetical protein